MNWSLSLPKRPPKPCAYPGCPTLTLERHCDRHKSFESKRSESRRLTSARRRYGYRWQQARAAYLRKHPLCVICVAEKRYEPATLIDHIVPHRGDIELFWNRDNWQSLCKRHHDQKTAKEDGGFGS